MTSGSEIRRYDYVNHPYARVRDALKRNALAVFHSATKAAVSRLESVAAELHIDLGTVGVQKDITISMKNVEENPLPGTEAQLDFWGFYEPPFGTAGKAINAVAGHRIAESSVHRFIEELAAYARRTLG